MACLLAALGSPRAQAGLKEAALRLPESLAAEERLPVAGRQGWKFTERITFGDWEVRDVKRSLTKGSDLQILVYEGSKRRQTFGFSLAHQGQPVWRGAAATNLHRRAVDLEVEIELRNRSGFAVNLSPLANPDEGWTLELQETRERPLRGTLARGSVAVGVEGTNRLAGTPFPLGDTAGYVFAVEKRAVAAVEVINDGAVWIARDLAPELRGPVQAAIAALLLFEELRPTLPP